MASCDVVYVRRLVRIVVDQLLVSHYYFVFVAHESNALVEFTEWECTTLQYT